MAAVGFVDVLPSPAAVATVAVGDVSVHSVSDLLVDLIRHNDASALRLFCGVLTLSFLCRTRVDAVVVK